MIEFWYRLAFIQMFLNVITPPYFGVGNRSFTPIFKQTFFKQLTLLGMLRTFFFPFYNGGYGTLVSLYSQTPIGGGKYIT
ncbi:MAG: hypothetical protein OXC03_10855 [Flavobacteriaceae bacterium]|nr:hypothetical protein [Flavobacteriaceae bacterium]